MDDIIDKLVDYSLTISINDYMFTETIIKIIYHNIDVKTITKEKLNIALSEIIAGIYKIKINELYVINDIDKIENGNKIIKKLKDTNYKRLIINKCIKYI